MFERYDEGARQVVVMAVDVARTLGHHEVGPLHLLLACFDARYHSPGRPYTEAHWALKAAGVDRAVVEESARAVHGWRSDDEPRELPFASATKQALELSLREALSSGHDSVRGEHLLVALTRTYEVQHLLPCDELRQVVGRIWLAE